LSRSTAAIEETADMDECAAGAVEQAVDRAAEAIRLGQGLAEPAGIEQILFPPRSIVRIDDRTSAPLDFSAKSDLDIIGGPGPGRGEDEGAGPTPLGDLQISVFQARPEPLDIPAIFGELGRHPLPQLPGSGAVGPNDRSGVAPIIIVDAGQAEIEARKGCGERGHEIRVGRGGIESCQNGLDRGRIGNAKRGGAHRMLTIKILASAEFL